VTTISNLEAHGIPVEAGGKLVKTTTVVQNIDQLRSLFDHGFDEAGREAHYQALFGGISNPEGASAAQRIAAHVIGNGELSDEDKAHVAGAFPMTVNVIASPKTAGTLTVTAPYSLSSTTGPMIVTFTDVVLEEGGYFVCEGTLLSFTCTNLTRNGGTGNTSFADFNILGITPDTPAPQGPNTSDPGQATNGTNGDCSSAGVADRGGSNGSPGSQGATGSPGTPGSPGIASQPATITITGSLNSAITIFSQSGGGGNGGAGGQGGTGQKGGNGGNGATCDCTGSGAGNGGSGGTGGTGGNGGNGGNATTAAGNIAVYVHNGDQANLVSYTAGAATIPGTGGAPGGPGAVGTGGDKGSGGKHNGDGSAGGAGNQGSSGTHGHNGSGSGQPAGFSVGIK
jgi:hypothetical protein